MSNQYPVASRLLTLIDRVDRGRPLRLAEIMAEFGVDRTSAHNYRKFVARHRDLVEEWEGKTKVWRKAASPDTRVSQAAALAFAVHALAELDGSDHLEELQALADQARVALGDVERIQLDRLTRNFRVQHQSRTRNPNRGKHIRKLMEARGPTGARSRECL